MKHVFKLMVAAVLAVSMLGLASCKKEEVKPAGGENPDQPGLAYETLVGTEWEGTFVTRGQEVGHTNVSMIFHWTVDFLQDGKGEVMFWVESPELDPDEFTWEFDYTYDGNNAGVLTDSEGDHPLTIDPYNRTMSVELVVGIQHVEDGPAYLYGGQTTLHQTR